LIPGPLLILSGLLFEGQWAFLCEKAEDESRHEIFHVVLAVRFIPPRVILAEFDVEFVEPPRGPYVKSAFANLFDRTDASQR
jgi:hypothetical protein